MKLKTCYLLCTALCSALLPLAVLRAQGNNVVTIGEIPTLHLSRNAAAEEKLTLQLRAGFHVNSNKPNDEFLIPLKLTWSAIGAVTADPPEYPAPKLEKAGFSDKPLSVFDGTFRIVTRFHAGANAAPAAGVLTGRLRYQACNNRECLQPKTIDLKLPYEIE